MIDKNSVILMSIMKENTVYDFADIVSIDESDKSHFISLT